MQRHSPKCWPTSVNTPLAWPNLYGRPLTGPALTCYGCCRCQKEHRRGIDPEYADHLIHQSKRGTYERAPLDHGEKFAYHFEAAASE